MSKSRFGLLAATIAFGLGGCHASAEEAPTAEAPLTTSGVCSVRVTPSDVAAETARRFGPAVDRCVRAVDLQTGTFGDALQACERDAAFVQLMNEVVLVAGRDSTTRASELARAVVPALSSALAAHHDAEGRFVDPHLAGNLGHVVTSAAATACNDALTSASLAPLGLGEVWTAWRNTEHAVSRASQNSGGFDAFYGWFAPRPATGETEADARAFAEGSAALLFGRDNTWFIGATPLAAEGRAAIDGFRVSSAVIDRDAETALAATKAAVAQLDVRHAWLFDGRTPASAQSVLVVLDGNGHFWGFTVFIVG